MSVDTIDAIARHFSGNQADDYLFAGSLVKNRGKTAGKKLEAIAPLVEVYGSRPWSDEESLLLEQAGKALSQYNVALLSLSQTEPAQNKQVAQLLADSLLALSYLDVMNL